MKLARRINRKSGKKEKFFMIAHNRKVVNSNKKGIIRVKKYLKYF